MRSIESDPVGGHSPRSAAVHEDADDVAYPSWKEMALVAGLLTALALALFGPHILHGGLYNDDWEIVVKYHFSRGLFGAFHAFSDPFRPVERAYWVTVLGVLHAHASGMRAAAAAVGVFMSGSLYLLLRTLKLERFPAVVVAALTLIFPAGDSTKLWFAASAANLAIAFSLLGIAVGLRGLSARTNLRSVILRGTALGLFVLAVMTYEVSLAVVAIAVFVYRLRASWRVAVTRWLPNAMVVAVVFLILQSTRYSIYVQPLRADVEHALLILKQAPLLLAQTVVPLDVPRVLILGAMAAVVAAAAMMGERLPFNALERELLRRWILTATAAVLAIGAGYVSFLTTSPLTGVYAPLDPGEGNRINVLAAVGFVLLAYSIAEMAGLMLARGVFSRLAWGRFLAVGLFAFGLALSYTWQLRTDVNRWDRAASDQRHILLTIDALIPDRPSGAVVYTSGHPISEMGVPVFETIRDTTGALQLHWNDRSVSAYPIIPGTTVLCEGSSIVIRNSNDVYVSTPQTAHYEHAYIVNVELRSVRRIDNRPQCLDVQRRL